VGSLEHRRLKPWKEQACPRSLGIARTLLCLLTPTIRFHYRIKQFFPLCYYFDQFQLRLILVSENVISRSKQKIIFVQNRLKKGQEEVILKDGFIIYFLKIK
jgi:hypothetical protein